MTADTVFSLILGPDIHRDLRGAFCLRQYSNPLKYNICRRVSGYFTLRNISVEGRGLCPGTAWSGNDSTDPVVNCS